VKATLSPTQSVARDLYAVAFYLIKGTDAEIFRTIADLDLSLTQIKALGMLDAMDEETSLGGIAEALNVSLPAASRAVDGLVKRALIQRTEDPGDRRMKQVRITKGGSEVVRALHDARLSKLEAFVDALPDEDTRRLAAALEPIANRPDIASCRRP
jgi:DNA-binding MarR family transcriptional regulator